MDLNSVPTTVEIHCVECGVNLDRAEPHAPTCSYNEDVPACPGCGSDEPGTARFLGHLGARAWFRCTACGWDFHNGAL